MEDSQGHYIALENEHRHEYNTLDKKYHKVGFY